MTTDITEAVARVRAAHDQAAKHESLSASIMLADICALLAAWDRAEKAEADLAKEMARSDKAASRQFARDGFHGRGPHE